MPFHLVFPDILIRMHLGNAKLAYENGVAICPIAGWNVYELKNEQ